MKVVLWVAAIAVFGALPGTGMAQGPVGMEPKILDMTRGNWVYFRDFNGRQLLYFTHLESYRCGIDRVSYSLDSDALDREWKLQPCDPAKPHEITTDRPYISLPPGTASSVSVQLTFRDGSKSAVVRIDTRNKLLR